MIQKKRTHERIPPSRPTIPTMVALAEYQSFKVRLESSELMVDPVLVPPRNAEAEADIEMQTRAYESTDGVLRRGALDPLRSIAERNREEALGGLRSNIPAILSLLSSYITDRAGLTALGILVGNCDLGREERSALHNLVSRNLLMLSDSSYREMFDSWINI